MDEYEPHRLPERAPAVRLPSELLVEADSLVEAIQADPELRGGVSKVTRATVLRLALVRGLASLKATVKSRKNKVLAV